MYLNYSIQYHIQAQAIGHDDRAAAYHRLVPSHHRLSSLLLTSVLMPAGEVRCDAAVVKCCYMFLIMSICSHDCRTIPDSSSSLCTETHIVMPYVQHSQGWSEWKLTHVVCAGNSGYIVTSFRTLLFYNEIKIAHILSTLAHPCCCPAMGKHGSTEKIYYFPLVHFIFISLTHTPSSAIGDCMEASKFSGWISHSHRWCCAHARQTTRSAAMDGRGSERKSEK